MSEYYNFGRTHHWSRDNGSIIALKQYSTADESTWWSAIISHVDGGEMTVEGDTLLSVYRRGFGFLADRDRENAP